MSSVICGEIQPYVGRPGGTSSSGRIRVSQHRCAGCIGGEGIRLGERKPYGQWHCTGCFTTHSPHLIVPSRHLHSDRYDQSQPEQEAS